MTQVEEFDKERKKASKYYSNKRMIALKHGTIGFLVGVVAMGIGIAIGVAIGKSLS